ncbi:UBX domain-containing protein 10 [Basidiobolus ranarum]|uniref:UBX domain-containing protein 10 n=1 Tax=Basidiobolus ranarum TaxID=34480 RepID=A0ABR2W5M6_9FUNG
MSASNSLTVEQEDILSNFQTVTNITDVEKAVLMLSHNDWNIENAVREFLDEGHHSNTPEESTTSPAQSMNNERRNVGNYARPGLSFVSIVSFPVTLIWGILSGFFSLFYSLFVPVNHTVTRTRGRPINPRSAALKFIKEFEENHGGVRPEFFVGGYSDALSRAKRDVKYLLVILLSDGPGSNNSFCQDTLASERLVNFLREQEVIVWGGDTRGSEGHQVSNTLQARELPFVGLIGLQSTPGGASKMTLIEKIQGQSTPEIIVQRLSIQFQRTSAELQRAKREHQERESSRSIRKQQDEAYKQSLLADQEKERKAREERDRIEKANLEVERIETARLKLEEDRLKYRKYLLSTIPSEPAAEESETARLSFKMPDGERIIRRFRGNETVEDVYAFVDTFPLSIGGDSEPVEANPVPHYVYEFSFHLVTPFPRTVIEWNSNSVKIKDMPVLWPSASILIEEADPEEEAC